MVRKGKGGADMRAWDVSGTWWKEKGEGALVGLNGPDCVAKQAGFTLVWLSWAWFGLDRFCYVG